MKQVFECGIVAGSNDEVGDYIMAKMMDIPIPEPQDRKPPDDFTLEIHDRDIIRGTFSDGQNLMAKYEVLCDAMIGRGYECMKWRDEERFCYMLRFRRAKR